MASRSASLQPQTAVITPTLFTTRNNGLINSLNPIQLSAWRTNVDKQYIVSLQYCTKYVNKIEPQSQSLKGIYTSIIRSLQEGNTSLKAVQKLLTNIVEERLFCPGDLPPATSTANVHSIT